MKQTFTLEIDSSDYVSPVSECDLTHMIAMGFCDCRMGNLSILLVREITSQTVENQQLTADRPLVLKALDWSNRNEEETTCHEDERALDYMVGDREDRE